MKDYIIDFPTHQPHDWDIEVYCDNPLDNWCITLEQSMADEVTEWLCWQMEHKVWIKKIDVWIVQVNRRWWGEIVRNVS